ncbi:thiamine phosphate synthase [Zunongwangia pacifica]|uniref:Thiamine-phosphate synthase n=1 Tax=Zunongwangia pacifica TaxID=2911062 RepID=A0A9X2CNL5_9FLAO|nr:thiamine phosphate synthase [Zunongwangia pacifica]MCL6220680.1 thiamine phosphate synthase [Zunongwangia pacifica]
MNPFLDKNQSVFKKDISCLQYISQGNDRFQHLKNIETVLKAGGNWIQLRMKEMSQKEVLKTAILTKELCSKYKAKLIINDHVKVAKTCNAEGVHLGQEDTGVIEAREILGNHKIIGGTANTLQHCLEHLENGVDYIGLGPLRFTSTKKKLSPILGFSGYQHLMEDYLKRENSVPVIAIGGIALKDIQELKKIGLSGVAVSGLLTHSEHPENEIQQIYDCWGE